MLRGDMLAPPRYAHDERQLRHAIYFGLSRHAATPQAPYAMLLRYTATMLLTLDTPPLPRHCRYAFADSMLPPRTLRHAFAFSYAMP